jgi:hypothetical protein
MTGFWSGISSRSSYFYPKKYYVHKGAGTLIYVEREVVLKWPFIIKLDGACHNKSSFLNIFNKGQAVGCSPL